MTKTEGEGGVPAATGNLLHPRGIKIPFQGSLFGLNTRERQNRMLYR